MEKYIVRWVITDEKGSLFYPRQGRFTYESEGDALDQIDIIQAENVSYDFSDLRAERWQCFGSNYDPALPYDSWFLIQEK
jgi:hypothetical protein